MPRFMIHIDGEGPIEDAIAAGKALIEGLTNPEGADVHTTLTGSHTILSATLTELPNGIGHDLLPASVAPDRELADSTASGSESASDTSPLSTPGA